MVKFVVLFFRFFLTPLTIDHNIGVAGIWTQIQPKSQRKFVYIFHNHKKKINIRVTKH
jgi:hypothetical protein